MFAQGRVHFLNEVLVVFLGHVVEEVGGDGVASGIAGLGGQRRITARAVGLVVPPADVISDAFREPARIVRAAASAAPGLGGCASRSSCGSGRSRRLGCAAATIDATSGKVAVLLNDVNFFVDDRAGGFFMNLAGEPIRIGGDVGSACGGNTAAWTEIDCKRLGGNESSLGSIATILGYHSTSVGPSVSWTQSLSSGAPEVSMVISQSGL